MSLALLVIDATCFDYHIGYMDGKMYYQYLPEFFIEHNFSFYVKFPVGTALCELPFFLIAHIFTLIVNPAEAVGYGGAYEWAVACSGLFFFVLGLWLLYKVCLKLFEKKVALFSVMLLAVGTPLPYFATRYACFSHIYTFAMGSALIYLTMKIDEEHEKRNAFLIGLIVGWLFLIRNVNVLFVMFYGLKYFGDWKNWWAHLKRIFFKNRLPYHVMGGLLLTVPQFLYWKKTTGSFLLNTYSDESFTYLFRPKFYEVLFSDAKGYFILTPLMFFAVLGFLFVWSQEVKKYAWSVVAVFCYELFVTAAWWCWWFGGVFSIRTFLDVTAYMVLPLGALLQRICNAEGKYRIFIKCIYFVLIVWMVLVNIAFIKGGCTGIINETASNWWELKSALFQLWR